MSKDESTKDFIVTKNKNDSFFRVSKNCVPPRPLPRWLRQNQYPLYLPEMCEPLWSKKLFRGALMTISVGSSRGDWLLAALRLGSCAAAESAAAVGRLWRDGKKDLSDSPSPQPPGDPSSASAHPIQRERAAPWPSSLWADPTPSRRGDAGPGTRPRSPGPPSVALPPAAWGEAYGGGGCASSRLLLGGGRRGDEALSLQTL